MDFAFMQAEVSGVKVGSGTDRTLVQWGAGMRSKVAVELTFRYERLGALLAAEAQ